MARYFTPQPYHGPELGDAITRALEGFQQGFSMARGAKLQREDRARAEAERQDARDRQDATDAAQHHIYRGTRPVDATSVVSGVTLPSVGMPRAPHDGDAFAAALEREFASRTRGALVSPGQTPGSVPGPMPGAGSVAFDGPAVQPAAFSAPSLSLGGGMWQGMGQGMRSDPAAPTMETREAEVARVHAAVGLPGSFDPSTGTFRRPTLPVSPMMQQPDYRQLSPGRFQDVGAMREQQRREMEAKLTEAMLLAEGRAGVQARYRVPTQHESISRRVGELVSAGMSLPAANRQARLEHGLTDGDGTGRGPDTPPEVARQNLPIFERDVREDERDLRALERDTPRRKDYPFLLDPEGALASFTGDSTAFAPRLTAAERALRESRIQRDSVRAEATGQPWRRPVDPSLSDLLEPSEGAGRMADADHAAMIAEFAEAKRLYDAAVARGMGEGRARALYDAAVAGISEKYGAPTVGGR